MVKTNIIDYYEQQIKQYDYIMEHIRQEIKFCDEIMSHEKESSGGETNAFRMFDRWKREYIKRLDSMGRFHTETSRRLSVIKEDAN